MKEESTMKKTQCKLDQLSEVTQRNHDRDIEFSETLFLRNHLPKRFEEIKRKIPKPGKVQLFGAIVARYVEELSIA